MQNSLERLTHRTPKNNTGIFKDINLVDHKLSLIWQTTKRQIKTQNTT